jgi:hypothetical protein
MSHISALSALRRLPDPLTKQAILRQMLSSGKKATKPGHPIDKSE